MHPILNVAIQAIRKAGNFIIKQYEFINRNNSYLSSDYVNILINKINIESKHIITTVINKFYPSHTTNTDKQYALYNKDSDNMHWIINTIDSNINFIKQFPFFALSIAVQYKEYIEIGVIYDPIHNELFSACRGKGAQCNGYRIRLRHNHNNSITHLNTIILAIPYSSYFKSNMVVIDLLNSLNKQYITVDFRRTGSTILDLAYVAIGRIDGCLITSLQKTNILASGVLIIKESGGFITDFNGQIIHNNYPDLSGNLIVGNDKIIKIILSLIKKYTERITHNI